MSEFQLLFQASHINKYIYALNYSDIIYMV